MTKAPSFYKDTSRTESGPPPTQWDLILTCSSLRKDPISKEGHTPRSQQLRCALTFAGASLAAQTVKNLPATQETRVQSLAWEDLLEKGMATHSNILAWRIPWTEEPGGLHTVHGVAERRTGLSDSHAHTYFCGATGQPSTPLLLEPLWSLVLGSRPVLQPHLRPVIYGFAQVPSLSVSPQAIWGLLGSPSLAPLTSSVVPC